MSAQKNVLDLWSVCAKIIFYYYILISAATLMWIAGSARLREALKYCHLFGEIVHFQNIHKVSIFRSNVVSVLLYGSSTWKVTKSITNKLQILVIRCLRSIIHIYWSNTISNTNLLKMADMQQIDVIIRRHKRGWIGHNLRKESLQWPDKLCNGILWMVLEEKRGDLVRHGDELWKGSARI